MALKDASAYNVQFHRGRPILIDTLSFERYEEGQPWVAYRQFCRHFLAPLALASLVDSRLLTLSRVNIDGVPLDLASRLLPSTTKFKPGLLAHIHVHAKSDRPDSGGKKGGTGARLSKTGLLALVDSLKGTVEGLHWKPEGTEWADYYSDTNYSSGAMESKRSQVMKAVEGLDPKPLNCWDLGANNGEFSRLVASQGIDTIAWDVDPAAVEKAYLAIREGGEGRIVPLVQDLTNPSPDLGWDSNERDGLIRRGPADLILALALIHHLAIGNNVPLGMIAEFFAQIGRFSIVEFVPKEDSQVQRMLVGRRDVFDGYTHEGWEAALEGRFEVLQRLPVADSVRTLYVLQRKG
jgi:ribosomal protein L11 methylase PrmA